MSLFSSIIREPLTVREYTTPIMEYRHNDSVPLEPWTVIIQVVTRSEEARETEGPDHSFTHVIPGDRNSFNLNEIFTDVDIIVEIPRSVGGEVRWFHSPAPSRYSSNPFTHPTQYRIFTVSGPRERMNPTDPANPNRIGTQAHPHAFDVPSTQPNSPSARYYGFIDPTVTGINTVASSIPLQSPTFYASPSFIQPGVGDVIPTELWDVRAIDPEEAQRGREEEDDEDRESPASTRSVSSIDDLASALREHLKFDLRMEVIATELCLKFEVKFIDEVITEIDEAIDIAEIIENMETE